MYHFIIFIIYFVLLMIWWIQYKIIIKQKDEFREHCVKLIRLIDLRKQIEMLEEINEIQGDNCLSRHDIEIQNAIKKYLDDIERQIEYLNEKKEPSK